jgi:hypothetical protein
VPDVPRSPYLYAIIRVVPHVERGETLNAGVVLLCRTKAYLGAVTELDRARLRAIAPEADVETIADHLRAVERIARGDPDGGPIARLTLGERFHWIVAPASTMIQPSAVHTGLTDDPGAELARLVEGLVR